MTEKPKPVRKPRLGVRSILRIPEDGPLTPRLQRRDDIQAIGFTARICEDD